VCECESESGLYARTLSLIEIDPESEPSRAFSTCLRGVPTLWPSAPSTGRWGRELRSVFYPFCIANLWDRTSFFFLFFFFFFTLMQQSIRPTTTFLTSDRGSDEESPRISPRASGRQSDLHQGVSVVVVLRLSRSIRHRLRTRYHTTEGNGSPNSIEHSAPG